MKQVVYCCLFRKVIQSNEACIDLQIIDTSEMTTPKRHSDTNYTGLDLQATYFVLLQFDPLRCMYVLSSMIVPCESLSTCYC